jgi:hypothetical protein
MATHEDFSREHEIRGSSDRSFGLVCAAFFLWLALWPLRHARPMRGWALVVGLAFLAMGALRPSLLHGLNLAWIRLGVLLGKIMNPVFTTVLFFLVFTPAGLVFRLFGKDMLKLKFDSKTTSYWTERSQGVSPSASSMANQF